MQQWGVNPRPPLHGTPVKTILLFISEGLRSAVFAATYKMEESSSTKAYFGALAFTKPLGETGTPDVVPSCSPHWLSKPKGPHLVEATGRANPERALAIAVTRRMLYENETPLVGVGLVYKPHYIFHRALQLCLHAFK